MGPPQTTPKLSGNGGSANSSPGLQPAALPPAAAPSDGVFAGLTGGTANGAVTVPSSPAWPTNILYRNSPQQRVQPHFAAEPPLLDLATGSVFESPALMPANMALAIPAVDLLPTQMENGQPDLPANPFARAALPAKVGSASEPAEGGILMLHDLQESHASRAALASAWRDYGAQLLPGGEIAPSSRGAGAMFGHVFSR